MAVAAKFDLPKQELERLYQIYSCAQIGAQFSVNPETVRKALKRHGITAKKAGGRRTFDPPKQVLEAMYQTKSMRDIALEFGVGETVVFNRLKEHGIELTEHRNHRLRPGRVFTDEHKANIRKSLIANAAYGEKNPNWKGGLTEINRRARNSWQAREWKQKALERAGHKCEECGVVDGKTCECCGVKVKLHVHHVKSFAKFPEHRFDPANSEVLCPKCHHTRHH
jgi:5-methylcytosine-specific restriction endonuclease McrA